MKRLTMTLALTMLLGACSAQRLSKDEINTVQLEKVTGRVRRYNCEGEKTSDKIEVIQRPTQFVELRPDEETDLYSSYFKNKTTGSRPSTWGFTKFTVSTEPEFFETRVKKGLNLFEYVFSICAEWSEMVDPETGAKTCLKVETWEEGTFEIDVLYSERRSKDVSDIHPSEADCTEG
jgi:hypothetical protein